MTVINTFVAQRQNQIAREENAKHKAMEWAADLDASLQEFLNESNVEIVEEERVARNEEGFMLLGEARELLIAARESFDGDLTEQSINYLIGETNAVIMAHREVAE